MAAAVSVWRTPTASAVRDQPQVLELRRGAARGVELHRQRHELEEHGEAEDDQRHRDQPGELEDDAGDEQEEPGLRAERRQRPDGRAQRHGHVGLGVLDGVPHLVGGDGRRRHRAAGEHGLAEKHAARLRGS